MFRVVDLLSFLDAHDRKRHRAQRVQFPPPNGMATMVAMRKPFLAVLAVLSVAGCAPNANTLGAVATGRIIGTTPDGHAKVRVACRGDMDNCYERAGQICKFGFDVIDEGGQNSTAGAMSHCDDFGNCYATPINKFNGVLFVACRHQNEAIANKKL